MIKFIKTYWKYIAFFTPMALGIISWVMHVEDGLDVNDDIKHLQTVVEPLVRQHIFEEEMRTRGLPMPVPAHTHPEYELTLIDPAVPLPSVPPPAFEPSAAQQRETAHVREDAAKQARDMVQRPLKH